MIRRRLTEMIDDSGKYAEHLLIQCEMIIDHLDGQNQPFTRDPNFNTFIQIYDYNTAKAESIMKSNEETLAVLLLMRSIAKSLFR